MATANIIALVGGQGMLGRMVRWQAPAAAGIVSLARSELNITDRDQVLRRMAALRPRVIINCAGYTEVDKCEFEEESARQVNGLGPGFLAEAAREIGATLVHISSDYVFDGKAGRPYREEDATGPGSAYGRSKLLGEQSVQDSGLKKYFIIRTSWLYGPGGNNFVETILRLAREKDELKIVADQVGSPTYTRDLARGILQLLKTASAGAGEHSPIYGLYHFADTGQCSWFEFAREIIHLAAQGGMELKVRSVAPIRTEEYPRPAPRPAFSALTTDKYQRVTGADIPSWQESLKEYLSVSQQPARRTSVML
ncbi:MAG: dTDP-4-dehydrorhamnose reductase [Desulfobacterales bacterium]|nr:dTDP-4-dehydrorhamnose reductase [Desulfobacterales bacterium]